MALVCIMVVAREVEVVSIQTRHSRIYPRPPSLVIARVPSVTWEGLPDTGNI